MRCLQQLECVRTLATQLAQTSHFPSLQVNWAIDQANTSFMTLRALWQVEHTSVSFPSGKDMFEVIFLWRVWAWRCRRRASKSGELSTWVWRQKKQSKKASDLIRVVWNLFVLSVFILFATECEKGTITVSLQPQRHHCTDFIEITSKSCSTLNTSNWNFMFWLDVVFNIYVCYCYTCIVDYTIIYRNDLSHGYTPISHCRVQRNLTVTRVHYMYVLSSTCGFSIRCNRRLSSAAGEWGPCKTWWSICMSHTHDAKIVQQEWIGVGSPYNLPLVYMYPIKVSGRNLCSFKNLQHTLRMFKVKYSEVCQLYVANFYLTI